LYIVLAHYLKSITGILTTLSENTIYTQLDHFAASFVTEQGGKLTAFLHCWEFWLLELARQGSIRAINMKSWPRHVQRPVRPVFTGHKLLLIGWSESVWLAYLLAWLASQRGSVELGQY
jgi:hypothetical protein